jgi:hypothetical protein
MLSVTHYIASSGRMASELNVYILKTGCKDDQRMAVFMTCAVRIRCTASK